MIKSPTIKLEYYENIYVFDMTTVGFASFEINESDMMQVKVCLLDATNSFFTITQSTEDEHAAQLQKLYLDFYTKWSSFKKALFMGEFGE